MTTQAPVSPERLTRKVFITTFLAVIVFVGVTLLLHVR